MLMHRRFLQILSSVVIMATMFSGFVLPSAAAQGKDGLKRQFNAQTGKVSFIGPETGRVLSASRALGITSLARSADPGMALVKRFGPEFRLTHPERDLTELKTNRLDDGRMTIRYQQNYQGIPIIGGELIVNTNDNGDLYSINGEISTDFSIPTQPKIDSDQARQTALQAVAKWYEKAPENFVASEPQLWIYDESLMQTSTRPAELVWRIEVTARDVTIPVRELVLVNAERGHISLHFSQIDTAWSGNQKTLSVLDATHGNLKSDDEYVTTNSTPVYAPLQAGVTWYVAMTGSNSNSCTSVASPCRTINGTIAKATAGDIIKVATGTYTGTGSQVVNISKSITLSGGWNASFTTQDGMSTIDGQTARRGITTTGPNVVIDRFVIQNGFHPSQGGGVNNNGSTLTLSNNRIINNVSQGTGGGIFNYGSLTINNTSITDNRAGDLCCSSGGGGAGIENWNSTLSLNNSLVAKNTLVGIFQGSGIDNAGTVILNNSTVSGNTGGNGVGISSGGGTVVLNNSTVSENQSYGFLSYGNVTLQNTIIARNGANGDCSNGGTISSSGYNLIGDNTGCPFVATMGDIIGTNVSSINPYLTPLQDNGGPTFTHALMVSSPAIDAGNPAMPGSGGNACLGTDQRGISRPVGTRCDIGAYEGSAAPTLTALVSTYTAGNSISLPGTFICSQADPNCAAGDSHARAAHKYAIGTYNLYTTQHSRNSIDNNGMIITSSVHYGTGYTNAFWNGNQIVYGDAYGFPLADDVVAHELTHGVTQYESNLFYYYQSGAINESFSDLWGEYYDQSNGQGTDTSGVKWQIGEDISGTSVLRSMSNPTLFGDPDKMSSVSYYEGADDSGGVHTNSGVNNKAVFLMVEGGTFNGKTVTALGWEKTAAIYYDVNANLLSSGADYSDLYYALQQACSNLIGQQGITFGDCLEVKDAIDAVEMNAQPASNFNTDAPYCDTGNPTATIFSDGLESGKGNWTFSNGANTRWQLDSPYGPYAHSGTHFLYADDYPAAVTDASAQLASVTIPSGAYLRFAHAYDFEASDYYYDGGLLEYSINGGATWEDAGSLIDFNGYRGTVFTGAGNPFSGHSAFVGASHGYISTRLNLTSLAGKTVTFRWRMGLDQAAAAWGWWVDDVQIYRCQSVVKAILIAPSDVISSVQPSYSWKEVSGSTWYYLWINDTAGNIFKQWYTSAQANCNGTTCSVMPSGLTLKSGSYTWWVQTWNSDGGGPWSDEMTFSISLPPPLGKATLVSPGGSIAGQRPTYTWNQVSGSTWYYLWVDGPAGNLIKTWYTSTQANCNAGICSVTPAITLSTGAHTWWVQTWSDAGYGPWSDGMTFSISPPPLPGKATLVSPSGSIGTNNPVYTWNKVSGATWYYLSVSGSSGYAFTKWYTDAEVCGVSTCSATNATPSLGAGAYIWQIQTWNDAGYGPSSDALNFNPAPPGKATLVSPNGSINDQTPIYTWNAISDAAWYYLWVNNASGVVIQRWYKAIDICNSSTCSIEDPTVLSAGAHVWWIQTWNDAGYGPWSDAMNFNAP